MSFSIPKALKLKYADAFPEDWFFETAEIVGLQLSQI